MWLWVLVLAAAARLTVVEMVRVKAMMELIRGMSGLWLVRYRLADLVGNLDKLAIFASPPN